MMTKKDEVIIGPDGKPRVEDTSQNPFFSWTPSRRPTPYFCYLSLFYFSLHPPWVAGRAPTRERSDLSKLFQINHLEMRSNDLREKLKDISQTILRDAK
jgi:hypothetical protein